MFDTNIKRWMESLKGDFNIKFKENMNTSLDNLKKNFENSFSKLDKNTWSDSVKTQMEQQVNNIKTSIQNHQDLLLSLEGTNTLASDLKEKCEAYNTAYHELNNLSFSGNRFIQENGKDKIPKNYSNEYMTYLRNKAERETQLKVALDNAYQKAEEILTKFGGSKPVLPSFTSLMTSDEKIDLDNINNNIELPSEEILPKVEKQNALEELPNKTDPPTKTEDEKKEEPKKTGLSVDNALTQISVGETFKYKDQIYKCTQLKDGQKVFVLDGKIYENDGSKKVYETLSNIVNSSSENQTVIKVGDRELIINKSTVPEGYGKINSILEVPNNVEIEEIDRGKRSIVKLIDENGNTSFDVLWNGRGYRKSDVVASDIIQTKIVDIKSLEGLNVKPTDIQDNTIFKYNDREIIFQRNYKSNGGTFIIDGAYGNYQVAETDDIDSVISLLKQNLE